ncbi:MAG: DUF4097 family beta strand repeat protein [Phycisphaerae bacterium]|nr:DUF4097 family beta strand repeat protein [Phycisphaerae bacterium]
MKQLRSRENALACLCLLLLLATLGCDIEVDNWAHATHERTVALDIPLTPGSAVDVDTQLGSVTVTGADVADCNIVAEIVARAPTQEEARQLAEQVQIATESSQGTLKIRADKPRVTQNRSISVSYTVTAPRQTSVVCRSAYGSLEIARLNGSVTGKTSSGTIEIGDIEGAVDVSTSYGSVACKNVAGPTVKLRSSSGSITATNVRAELQAETAYGPVTCDEIAADELRLKSSSGTISISSADFRTCDAHTSYGAVRCDGLRGDSIKLHSGSGSVDLLTSSADTMDLSTSYGRIKADGITTTRLTAKSSSGDVDVLCSDSTPASLTADARTVYGSIRFTAPPAFSGGVYLATSYGTVRTDRPITVSGELTKKKINGTMGDGPGTLRLETGSGSIVLK